MAVHVFIHYSLRNDTVPCVVRQLYAESISTVLSAAASIPIQDGRSLSPVKNGGGASTGVFLHYSLYTVFTHRLVFSFINFKCSCTPISPWLVSDDCSKLSKDLLFTQNVCHARRSLLGFEGAGE